MTTGKLIEEMADLERLTTLPSQNYKTVQFSSYDRRSKTTNDSCWFSNEDGFGNEPIPAFEEVISQPDSGGIGRYLICDVKGPGAIVRLWTANINGNIRLFLDNTDTPVFDGTAQDFFWKPLVLLSGKDPGFDYSSTIRQFDANYFPVPFSGRCRIEWTGDISKIHFYHVGIRIYDPDVMVETYKASEADDYIEKLKKVNNLLENPGNIVQSSVSETITNDHTLGDGNKAVLFSGKGSKAINEFSVRIKSPDIEQALRKSIITMWFDNSSGPQVEAPLGDFFGSAPGLNQYRSLPFEVTSDSTLICRFIMPYRVNAKIELANMSGSGLTIHSSVKVEDFKWIEGRSMHFRARWSIDHSLTASYFDQGNYNVSDILYLMTSGKGRIAGAAAFIYNPSNATTSWGNWWGEGDEKIFVDNDTFPSFYGTGSEDYFNYSWSSTRIFSYPYCGQPRNDGPGNRGYVSNYRWHISDDILFSDKAAFFMELGHHGLVHEFSYGRIVYFYALPGTLDNYSRISASDIRDVIYPDWQPIAYLGSSGYRYTRAEELISKSSEVRIEPCRISSGNKILVWYPENGSDQLSFKILCDKSYEKTNIGFTLRHDPSGGTVAVHLNGKPVKIDGKAEIQLNEPFQTFLANHFTEKVDLIKGINEIVLESNDKGVQGKVGIDFIWMKKD
ncbi:MAG: DUF2961 domain-containing protein [Bacteroidetes bacterium]|nr:DUF2961 domain-containing protein [Bacteroidota bacterium]